MIPLIDLKAQYSELKDEMDRAVLEVLESSRYIMGAKVKELEKNIAAYTGTKHAISCANGTDALILSLHACGIKEGDEVITTPFTFFATAEAISRVGAKPVFADVKADTFNIDVTQIQSHITDRTKAVIPVHLFGQPAEMDTVCQIAEKYHLYVIEDACQAFGAEYQGRKAGSLGDIGCFSFFPTKNLGAYGDGGIITTNDDNAAATIRALRVHGSGKPGCQAYNLKCGGGNDNVLAEGTLSDNTIYDMTKYYNYFIGYNSRLDEIQAAVLLVKMKHLDNWNAKRREIAGYYTDRLHESSLVVPKILEEATSICHMYALQSENRDKVTCYLNQMGIATGIYYPVPLHLQKAYTGLGYKYGDFPVSEYLAGRTFAIPVYPELTQSQKEHIADTLLQAAAGNIQ